MSAPHGLAEGHVIAARYEIVRPLGSGGYANVYEAIDRTLRKHVAIKLLRDDRLSPSALRRFRREVALAQQVTTLHVVRVFDIGEDEGRTFLTMELVEGETLRDRLARGPLAVTEALDIAESVLHALEELHALGIVHRDVKPSNVLIDQHGHVKLADLGLARDLASNETRATQDEGLLGTWEYISPEQALGKDSDERSDLYSFAVMLYECLTGTLPFGERGALGSILAHVKEAPRPVRKLRPEVPRWLAAIIGRLLEKSPSRRLRSATEVLRALERERAPLDVNRILRWGAVVMLAIAAAALFWYVRQSRFDHLAAEGTGIAARDSLNRKLWSRSDVLPQSAAVLTLPGGRKGVAALPGTASYAPRGNREELLILDALSGEVLERHKVEGFAGLFPGFADDFSRTDLITTDIDHDGINELVVTYIHVYYPSLTLMYDAAINRIRYVLVASGHHHCAASVDVTGDGRDELLFVGTNNRLGWHTAVAAVDVIPTPQSTLLYFGAARTPDSGSRNYSGRGPNLTWYALLPPGYPQTTVIPESRQIVARYPDGRSLRLDFDGFIIGTGSKAKGLARAELRRQAYTTLQRAELAARGGDTARYAAEAQQAVAEAEAAGDPHLLQWVSRVHARALIAAGRRAEAEDAFARIAAVPEMESDASFDAGREYHLAGQLEDAVRWYRRGYLSGHDHSVGRMRLEILEAAVLAWSEMGRLDRAEEAIDDYERVSAGQDLGHLRDFVDWRKGTLRGAGRPTIGAATDAVRYWKLEYAHALREAPERLLPKVLAEEERNGSLVGLVRALKAKLLADLGRLEEAGAAIEAAERWHERMRTTDVTARAHTSIVHARRREIERQLGSDVRRLRASAR